MATVLFIKKIIFVCTPELAKRIMENEWETRWSNDNRVSWPAGVTVCFMFLSKNFRAAKMQKKLFVRSGTLATQAIPQEYKWVLAKLDFFENSNGPLI